MAMITMISWSKSPRYVVTSTSLMVCVSCPGARAAESMSQPNSCLAFVSPARLDAFSPSLPMKSRGGVAKPCKLSFLAIMTVLCALLTKLASAFAITRPMHVFWLKAVQHNSK